MKLTIILVVMFILAIVNIRTTKCWVEVEGCSCRWIESQTGTLTCKAGK